MATPTPTEYKYEVLTASDFSAGLVALVQNMIVQSGYGSGGMVWPTLQATITSAISRAISSYVGGTKIPMSEMAISGTVSNSFLIGLSGLILGYLQKKSPLKQAVLAMEIDSLAYTIMQNLPASGYTPGTDPVWIGF